MPTRFRRTFKILPGVKVNVSKSGISYTVGAKGYHLNFSKRGVRQTVGLPGSGISHTSYLVKNDSHSEKEVSDPQKRREESADSEDEASLHKENESLRDNRRRIAPGWLLLLGIIVVYFGAAMLGLLPVNFLSQALRILAAWTRSLGL